MKTQKSLLLAALATGAMMALAPVAAQAGTVTVSGRINDGNGSAVLGATCTIEFASYDGETIITTQSNPYNDAAYSTDLPSDKKYRVWCMQNNGSICGEAILDLNGVTGPVTDQNYGMHSPAYCVTYDGDLRYFLSLDFAQAFAARTPSAESLEPVPGDDSKVLSTLVGRDWTYEPPIALRSAASSDVYAFLKPASADATNYVECSAFTTGVRIPAGATTPENAVTMSLKDTVADGQSIALSYEVELRTTNDATASVLTTPKAALPKSEFTLTVVGKTDDVEVTYDGDGHFITVNTNGFAKITVQCALSADGPWRSLKKIGALTNACVQTVYYSLYDSGSYANVYTNSATVTILPGDLTKTVFEVVTNGENTVKITGLKSGATLTDGALVIPETIGGCRVTEIAEMAFSGSQTITTVTIPTNVTTIGDWAFANCQKVTEIVVLGTPATVGTAIFRRAGIDNANGKQLIVRADETWFGTNIDALRNASVVSVTNETTAVVSAVDILGLSHETSGTWTIKFSLKQSSTWGTVTADNITCEYRALLSDTPAEWAVQSLTNNGDGTYSATVAAPDSASSMSGFFTIKFTN